MMFWVLFGSSAFAQVAPPIPSLPSLPKVTAPDTPPDMPPDVEENPLKIAERALTNAKDATEKLANQDAGDETQAAQKRTLKAIDDLLKKSENPPPMGGGNPPPPMGGGGGGGGGSPPPMGRSGKPMGNGKPMPMGSGQPMPMGSGQPMPMGSGQPMPGGGQPMPGAGQPMGGQPMGGQAQSGSAPGQGGAKSPPGVPLPEKITKDVWGHLPSQLRQQMSQFYRERFMPKYSELLRQYYSSLAEKEKEKK